jgi:iron complex transport system ATP-binding protein
MRLSITHLGYRANDNSLLKDVSLVVPSGGLTAVIGPNGAGKSTLLRVAAGDVAPTSGSVSYGDTPLSGMSVARRARSRAVLAPQQATEIPFTVHQVISMGRYPHRFDRGTKPETEQAMIESAIDLLDLGDLRHRQLRSLSGGEHQRVAIARVLAQRAPIILLDEPTTALDIRHQESVMTLLAELAANGHSVLAVLHDLNMVSHFDQVILLNEGRVAAAGTPQDVLTTERLTTVYGHPIDVVDHPTRPGVLMVPRIAPHPNTRNTA